MKRFALEQSDKMQYFLDEDGSCRFECMSSARGAQLQITYKGAQASRPADMIDVEEFVGVKSAKAKGKRLTTFDVDTLTFIEPEVAESELDEPLDEDVELIEEEGTESTEVVDDGGAPIEIIRNDVDDAESEQLNLF